MNDSVGRGRFGAIYLPSNASFGRFHGRVTCGMRGTSEKATLFKQRMPPFKTHHDRGVATALFKTAGAVLVQFHMR